MARVLPVKKYICEEHNVKICDLRDDVFLTSEEEKEAIKSQDPWYYSAPPKFVKRVAGDSSSSGITCSCSGSCSICRTSVEPSTNSGSCFSYRTSSGTSNSSGSSFCSTYTTNSRTSSSSGSYSCSSSRTSSRTSSSSGSYSCT